MTASDIELLDLNPSRETMRRLAKSMRPRDFRPGSEDRTGLSLEEYDKKVEDAKKERKAALDAALEEIGRRLRDHRAKQSGFTQNQLAKMVGRSQSHVVKVESKKCNPTLKTLILFKAALEKEYLDSLTDARRLMIPHEDIKWVSQSTPLREAAALMRNGGFSQLPVCESFEDVDSEGRFYESSFLGFLLDSALLEENLDIAEDKVKKAKLVGKDWKAPSDAQFDDLRKQMKGGKGALLIHDKVGGWECIIGIMTKTDLLREDFLSNQPTTSTQR